MIEYVKIMKRVKSQLFDTIESAQAALLDSISHCGKTCWEEIVYDGDKYYFEYITYIEIPKGEI